jgi:pimeloyl-ACP methyl ester carboxylesterase
MNTSNYITLTDSRKLCYAAYGDAAGKPVIYFHGMPACRLEAAMLDQAASKLGLRVLAPDRPGFGQSSFQPGRRITDSIDDIRQLADQLQLEHFYTLGLSGGCPYALACSWGLPERIIKTTIVSGLGEFAHSRYASDMAVFANMTLQATTRFPQTIQSIYRTVVASLVKGNMALLHRLLGSHNCKPDQAVWENAEVAALFDASLREAFAQGGRGPAYELTRISTPWGFRVEEIRIPVKFWHGEQDRTVPVGMSREIHQRISGSELEIFPEEGHFSLPIRRMERILGDFA